MAVATPIAVPTPFRFRPVRLRRRFSAIRLRQRQLLATVPHALYERRTAWRLASLVAPTRFVERPPRAGSAHRSGTPTGRPLYFPQRGRGIVVLDADAALRRRGGDSLLTRARRADRVVVTQRFLATSHGGATASMLASAGACIEHQSDDSLSHAQPTHLAPGSPRERELQSVRVRRHEAAVASGSPRPVSVLLATRRPADLPNAIDQLTGQSHGDLQLVVGLHGRGFDASMVDRLRREWTGDLVVAEFDEADLFGDVLQAITARADGDVVTKWDDDDWYGPNHIEDLLNAYDYSGADIVGKAAEFVCLEASNMTVRRFASGAESYSWTLAGGTLLSSVAWMREIGGWPPVSAHVDRHVLAATRRAGGIGYRTHGFQYLLKRRGNGVGHTWIAPDRYFLDTAIERRHGLDLKFADVVPHPLRGALPGSAVLASAV